MVVKKGKHTCPYGTQRSMKIAKSIFKGKPFEKGYFPELKFLGKEGLEGRENPFFKKGFSPLNILFG